MVTYLSQPIFNSSDVYCFVVPLHYMIHSHKNLRPEANATMFFT
jgi:hypothetical protein